MCTCTSRPSESNTAKAPIADLFEDLELILQAYRRVRAGGPAAIRIVRDGHDYWYMSSLKRYVDMNVVEGG